MGFGLAEGCVELSEKGYGPVSDAINAVTGKLHKMISTPLEGLNSAMEGVAGQLCGILPPAGATEEATGGARDALKDQERPARNAWLPTAGPLTLPALGEAVDTSVAQHARVEQAIHQEAAFVGLAQLAEKMQVEAARQAERQEELALQEQQNQHLGKLAAAVSGNVVNVAIQDAGAAARPDW